MEVFLAWSYLYQKNKEVRVAKQADETNTVSDGKEGVQENAIKVFK